VTEESGVTRTRRNSPNRGRDELAPRTRFSRLVPSAERGSQQFAGHSGATQVEVSFLANKDEVKLPIKDRGKEFDPMTLSDGLGLGSMRERFRLSAEKSKSRLRSLARNSRWHSIAFEKRCNQRVAALCHQTHDRFPEQLSGGLGVAEPLARVAAPLTDVKTMRSTVSSRARLVAEYSSAEMAPRTRSASSSNSISFRLSRINLEGFAGSPSPALFPRHSPRRWLRARMSRRATSKMHARMRPPVRACHGHNA